MAARVLAAGLDEVRSGDHERVAECRDRERAFALDLAHADRSAPRALAHRLLMEHELFLPILARDDDRIVLVEPDATRQRAHACAGVIPHDPTPARRRGE